MTNMANETYYKQLDSLDELERGLYRILKTFMSNDTKQCFPSIKTLMVLFKRCRKTTKKYLKRLEEKGFIEIKQRKVKHKVSNNKFNETNQYTLLLEKFQTIAKKKTGNNTKTKSDTIILAETDLEKIVKELQVNHSKEAIASALKCMRKNIRNGSIINNIKRYLESLINKSSNQLEQVNNLLESSKNDSNSTSHTKHQTSNYNTKNNSPMTRFHNFKQRTSLYTKEELDRIIRSNHERK